MWKSLFLKAVFCAIAALSIADGVTAQPGPGPGPTIFAPGIISGGAHDSAPTISPDGDQLYFSRSNAAKSAILFSPCRNGAWQPPTTAQFSGKWNDLEPAMAADGSYLVFVSNRPLRPDGTPLDGYFNGKAARGLGGNLWRVDKATSGWGTPVRLSSRINDGSNIFAPSLRGDGELSFMKPDPSTGRFRLYHIMPTDDLAIPVAYPFSTGEFTDVDPAIARDGSFVIFGSSRPPALGMDLFVAFRLRNGEWGRPIHLGSEINSPGSDAEPRLSPDGRTLYFSSERLAPVPDPRSRQSPQDEMDAMNRWNNGLYNIWSVSLPALLARLEGQDSK